MSNTDEIKKRAEAAMATIEFIDEVDNHDGTVTLTYKCSEEAHELLKQVFGEPLDEKLSKYITERYEEIFELAKETIDG